MVEPTNEGLLAVTGLNSQIEIGSIMALMPRTGGSNYSGQAAPPHRNIHILESIVLRERTKF